LGGCDQQSLDTIREAALAVPLLGLLCFHGWREQHRLTVLLMSRTFQE